MQEVGEDEFHTLDGQCGVALFNDKLCKLLLLRIDPERNSMEVFRFMAIIKRPVVKKW